MRFVLLAVILTYVPAGMSETRATSPSMADATTCAVYYRMLTGSMSPPYKDLGPLADMEKDKMLTLIDVAKEAAEREFGKEHAKEKFEADWAAKVAAMTDEINRNYDNVQQLRYHYGAKCKAMLKAVNGG